MPKPHNYTYHATNLNYIKIRIDVQPKRDGKSTVIAVPIHCDGAKIYTDCLMQRSVATPDMDITIDALIKAVSAKYHERYHTIPVDVPVPTIATTPGNGIYSAAYASLPDKDMLLDRRWSKSTRRQTKSYFVRQILPRLDKLGDNVGKSTVDKLVNELVANTLSNKNSSGSEAKAKETVSRTLGRMDKMLFRLHHYVPTIPYVQFLYHTPIAEKIEQEKAIVASVRVRLATLIALHPADPRIAGIALMFGMGHRTAEACAPRIKDFVIYCKQYVVYHVAQQIIDGERVEITKTSSSNRRTVGGKLVWHVVRARIDSLLESGYTMAQIQEMPLVSDPNDPARYLNPNSLSAFGRKILLACGYNDEMMAALEDLMYLEPDTDDEGVVITDPTCYILRRDWATRALNICGMSPADIDALLGHKRANPTSTVLSDPLVQCQLAKMLDRCVLFPTLSLHPAYDPITLTSDSRIVDIDGYTQYSIVNTTNAPMRVVLSLHTSAGGEHIHARTTGSVISCTPTTGRLDKPSDRTYRPVVLPPYPLDFLTQQIDIAKEINLSALLSRDMRNDKRDPE